LADQPVNRDLAIGVFAVVLPFLPRLGMDNKNPSTKIKSLKVDEAPTLPFTLDQIERMLKACLNYPHKHEGHFDTTIGYNSIVTSQIAA